MFSLPPFARRASAARRCACSVCRRTSPAACLTLIEGAASELRVGDPREIATHIGPVIEPEAKTRLEAYLAARAAEGRVIKAGEAPAAGCFVAPHIVRLDRVVDLREEVFGPVLHVVTWRGEDFDALIDEIVAQGYGLTMGLATRIERRQRVFAAKAPAGNHICEPQHDRRRRRRPALRRVWAFRHGAESRRPGLFAALFAGDDFDDQHRSGRGRCRADGDGGLKWVNQRSPLKLTR